MALIPDNAGAITADWLTSVLDTPIDAVRVVDTNSGTTGRAVIELTSESGGELPDRLFIKLPPTDPMQREFVRAIGMGRREVLFYQQLGAEVPMRVPHCYYAASNDSGEEYIMLLEHLEDSGCTFRNAKNRYSKDYIRQVLAAFARLHSSYWESPRFDTDLSWLQPLMQHEIAPQLVARALEVHADSMHSIFRSMAELYLAEFDAIHQLWQTGAPTLIHGDVHDGNMFFDQEQPGFLDWAVAARAPGMRDVGYFLAGTLAPQDQHAWGREMVDYYRQQLAANGTTAPPMEELWPQYQWHAAYVWVGATCTLAMGDEWQPVNYVKASLERLHTALDGLGSVEAIRSALRDK
ncbi:MAG: phosphotransferase [Halioglobus sp.]|nr:phosphotransferase [Halioglobus sp.]